MTWNYRIVKKTDTTGEASYAIHEAYYDAKGVVRTITEDPVCVDGATLDELNATWMQLAEAWSDVPLVYEDIEWEAL